jgi:hypothetical protein
MQEHLIAIGGCSTLRLKGVRYGTNHLVFRATKTQIRRIMTKCKSDKKFSFRIYSAGAAQKPNCLELEDGCLLGERHGLLVGLLLDFLLGAFNTLADEGASAGGKSSSGLNGSDHFELFVVLHNGQLSC